MLIVLNLLIASFILYFGWSTFETSQAYYIKENKVSKPAEAAWFFMCFFAVYGLVLFLITAALNQEWGANYIRQEAVRVGVAKYEADKDGIATFTWILPGERK